MFSRMLTRSRTRIPAIILFFIILYVFVNLISNNWTAMFPIGHHSNKAEKANILYRKNNQNQDGQLNEISILLAKINERLNIQDLYNQSQISNNRPINDNNNTAVKTVKKFNIFASNKVKEIKKLPPDLKTLLEEPKDKPPPYAKVNASFLPFLKDKNYIPSTCPKTVLQITKYSSWFRDRFIPDIKLFMDAEDVNDFTNFYKLAHYRSPFGFRSVTREVLGNILNNPNFTNPLLQLRDSTQKCVSCAVVGCGGILNGSKAGAEIDSHDVVFRLNRAKSSGRFAKDVGRKTTFYTFFPESQHIADVEDKDVSIMYATFKSYDFNYIANIINSEAPPPFLSKGKSYKIRRPAGISIDRLKLIHPDFFRYTFTRYLDEKSHRPTTGALIVILALQLCDEVDIYGYGYDPRFTMHYYDKKFVVHTDRSTASHDIDNERVLWKKLHEEGVLRFFKRDM
ncbi:CMP-N-acetylneuraminate-beta-galactosamide-alpha-2,3-sialyltransferase 1-like isoform X1 [Antedon mediterranea]|uniref:CMP-N-acetylneuraminate-beta-galactosamide- alpha-2,3-sialyltransferase 1-like isoform X1 n=1 Tax=Antedon mediterranea TaxID=105859 RepID=UPI003AF721F6